MPTQREAPNLVLLLEQCCERLRHLQRELEDGLSLVRLALSQAKAHGSRSTDRLELLLAEHRQQLLSELSAILQPGSEEAARHYFRMDTANRVARVGRRRIPLTETEFRLVELLWEEMPTSVSRETILERLYPGRQRPGEQVIDMFIFRIRQKFAAAGCTDAAIQSVRGSGWRLALNADGTAKPRSRDAAAKKRVIGRAEKPER